MQTAIQRAAPGDLPHLVELMARFYAEEGYPFSRRSRRRALEQLLGDECFGAAWVFRRQREVVGFLVVTFGFSLEFGGRDAFVDELYVMEAHRNQGLGSRALRVATAHCRRRGVAPCTWRSRTAMTGPWPSTPARVSNCTRAG
jgi:GNAT superfamily N-acetyltransferase